ncbi:DUF2796 domain-containing protein [Variovorax rhizosphaerae]|uniref:DUF2796 domain-containing protein n=1 Tax=Variovorax rhizosphaerae TaxID=1836200 RepID=A0ABU8WQE0_9BURK
MNRFFLRAAAAPLLLALCMLNAHAQPGHPHVHGQVKLDVAIDVRAITIHVDSPLDSIVGFERAPRTDAERKTAQQALAQLRAAGKLFTIDPAAGCTLSQVDLDAPTLGLGKAPPVQAPGHGDLEGNIVFECRSPVQARYVDVGLFDAFSAIRQIDVQIATPDGQYQRTLKRPSARLTWGRQ